MPRLSTLFRNLFRFVVLTWGAAFASTSAATPPPIDYGRDVRPILSEKYDTHVI